MKDGLYAKMTTSKGDILLQLFYDKTPLTVINFAGLAEGKIGPKKGAPFYDGLNFHRVIANFMIQGGCPQGTGTGGPGYKFEDEPVKGEYVAGAVAMANAGPNTNGSQFFICLSDLKNNLAKNYNLFGHVTEGMDTVLATQKGDTMLSVNVREKPRPA